VGAADDLARGQSQFMVEMNETANILNNATAKSLIVLDVDLAARVVRRPEHRVGGAEHLHNGVGAKTLLPRTIMNSPNWPPRCRA